MRESQNREFLQLAHDFEPIKHSIGGWFWSEKLDGMRAFWDGGITAGMKASDVPWANVEKHARFKEEVFATGLWSRYGQVIRAPYFWLDKLPHNIPLDGELWMGRGGFQDVMSTVKDHVGGEQWNYVRYMIFDLPPIDMVLSDGKINNPNFKKQFTGFQSWVGLTPEVKQFRSFMDFRTAQFHLEKREKEIVNEIVQIHNQHQLPLAQDAAIEAIETKCAAISFAGGEGLILRKPESFWLPKRTTTLLKVKKLLDSEATVVGCVSGRRTEKGSKLLGKMGALIVEWKGKRFELSGFTDEERMFLSDSQAAHAAVHPGREMPAWVIPVHFPVGSIVTFKYRELTKDGLPKEARYWRKVR